MDLYEAEKAKGAELVTVVCAECQRFQGHLGTVYESPAGPLYVADGRAAMRRLEGADLGRRVIADVKGRQENLGETGQVAPPTALDIALILDGEVTLAEPRSPFSDAPAPDLIAYCTNGHGDRPLTVQVLTDAISAARASHKRTRRAV